MTYGATLANWLLYWDNNAWNEFRLQVTTENMATEISPYLSYTDGYAMKASVSWLATDQLDTQVYGQCISGMTTVGDQAMSCWGCVQAGTTGVDAVHTYTSYYGTQVPASGDSVTTVLATDVGTD